MEENLNIPGRVREGGSGGETAGPGQGGLLLPQDNQKRRGQSETLQPALSLVLQVSLNKVLTRGEKVGVKELVSIR